MVLDSETMTIVDLDRDQISVDDYSANAEISYYDLRVTLTLKVGFNCRN